MNNEPRQISRACNQQARRYNSLSLSFQSLCLSIDRQLPSNRALYIHVVVAQWVVPTSLRGFLIAIGSIVDIMLSMKASRREWRSFLVERMKMANPNSAVLAIPHANSPAVIIVSSDVVVCPG